MEIQKLKSVTRMKKFIKWAQQQTEDGRRISELEDWSLEMIQYEGERAGGGGDWRKVSKTSETCKTEKVFEEIRAENIPRMTKYINTNIKKGQKPLSRINTKKSKLRYTIIQLWKTKAKRNFWKYQGKNHPSHTEE